MSGCLLVFAKPPIPGAVKRRLLSAIDEDAAARLAAAFLRDTLAHAEAAAVGPVIVAAAEAMDEPHHWPVGVECWPQGSGDLGARLQRCLRRGLRGAEWAMAIGADSPTVGPEGYRNAARALQTHEAVLGPTEDGGYHLIGLRRCPVGLLRGIPWSTAQTRAQTLARLTHAGLTVAQTAPCYDVDRPTDLQRLQRELAKTPEHAPNTARALQTLKTAAI